MNSSIFSRRGFSLIEMVVYIALLAILTVLAVNMTLSMTRAFADLRVSRDLNSSATALFERITRDIRGAYDVDAAGSVLGTNPGELLLNTKDAGGTNMTVEYFVSSGAVHIKENGLDLGPITSASTQTGSFVVREIIGANSKAVKVEVTLSATRGDITKQRNFYTTVVLRGTY
ncbi:MAG: hypothetical protein A2675_01790 [Candidatus Yonathbacteria bacterium RIFCSPHIGHO2_01_FULL_51_10]|uniref:Uncharacterized protein n=1 Tax=Candidatus Yonathbacteria bacterium RIFCSPHIGHO2_01_FULL_51_10 TaxID=1802723 RepID=A0A1G2S9V7_9BACT|nr:MAG: hypothetical protein A2675_01790 [Candidatus Yonathbacteria bacterium RIFCSPHIGHO2_01_FULL_51_10]